MLEHDQLADSEVFALIRSGQIALAGNRRLKIYGRLDCSAGRRMSRANRVFFESEAEAIRLGYRPCGRCLRREYRAWRDQRGRQ